MGNQEAQSTVANDTPDSRPCKENSSTVNAHALLANNQLARDGQTAGGVNRGVTVNRPPAPPTTSALSEGTPYPMTSRGGKTTHKDEKLEEGLTSRKMMDESDISTRTSQPGPDIEIDEPTDHQHPKPRVAPTLLEQEGVDQENTDAVIPEFMVNINYPVVNEEKTHTDPLAPWIGPLDAEIDLHGNDIPPSATVTVDTKKWPFPHRAMDAKTAYIYDVVKSSGCHNHEGAKIPLHTALNVHTWKLEATGHPNDEVVLQGIQFGFPIQYCGPPQYAAGETPNHASARCHGDHLNRYILEESAQGAVEGPFVQPPFTPWFVTSPLMTREKAGSNDRRIIVDLSFPDGGVNKYIIPHVFNGHEATHNLPTIESAVSTIANTCPGEVVMAVVDLSRAYRQFPVCPLDWPLLGVKVAQQYFFDRRLPFGARMSSYTMQMAADFIVRALERRGIKAHMYLDDVVIISPNRHMAHRQYDQTLHLIEALGLKVAEKKLQPPSPRVTWLGIQFDTENNSLAIPNEKLEDIKRCMAAAARKTTLTKKQLQRVIGVINHLAKVVRAARLFIGRILAAYRATEGEEVKVTRHVKADMKWFARFLSSANGRAILPHNRTVLRIWADACMDGGGASDGEFYYTFKFPPRMSSSHHITQLEAMNCMAAARAFVRSAHAGGIIAIHCDNKASIDAFKSGRAKDPVLAACSRAFWYKAAEMDTTMEFTHIPGEAMELPDALSRAHLDEEHRALADHLIRRLNLKRMEATPDMFSYASFL